MTQTYIAEQIKYWNKVIEDSFDPTTFVLNKKVSEAFREIEKLQNQCNHNFDNGFCIVCNKSEKAFMEKKE